MTESFRTRVRFPPSPPVNAYTALFINAISSFIVFTKKIERLVSKLLKFLVLGPFIFPIAYILFGKNPLKLHNKKNKSIKCIYDGKPSSAHHLFREVAPDKIGLYDQRRVVSLLYKKNLLGKYLRFFGKYFYKVEWRKCNHCENVFQNFPHTTQSLFNFYNTYYDDSFNLRKNKISSRNAYSKTIAPQYFLEKIDNKKGLRILDIGAAQGIVMKFFAEAGYESWGIEPSKERVEYGRKFLNLNNLFHGFYDPTSFEKDSFDLIFSHHVLEHFLEPNLFFEGVKIHLKKNGYLLLQLPSYEEDRTATTFNDHLIGFSEDSLCKILVSYGFRIIDSVTVPKDRAKIKSNDIKMVGNECWTKYGVLPGAISILAIKV